jgi:hypothetical protein
MAGFYDAPFSLRTEEPVEILLPESEELLQGRIDTVILQNRLWVIVVESKRTTLDVEVGIPQALAYLASYTLSNAKDRSEVLFGLVTNGIRFRFIKMSHPDYTLSEDFSLSSHQNELYPVLSVLKQIRQATDPSLIS